MATIEITSTLRGCYAWDQMEASWDATLLTWDGNEYLEHALAVGQGVTHQENRTRTIAKPVAVNLAGNETPSRTATSTRQIPVNLAAQEAPGRTTTTDRTLNENVATQEAPGRTAASQRTFGRGIATQEAPGRTATTDRTLNEAVRVNEQRTRQADKPLAVGINASTGAPAPWGFALRQGLAFGMTLAGGDYLLPALARANTYRRNSSTAKAAQRPLSEVLPLTEGVGKASTKAPFERQLRANEVQNKQATRPIAVAIASQEGRSKDLARPIAVALPVAEARAKNQERPISVALSTQEVPGRTLTATRTLNVALAAHEVRTRNTSKALAEGIRTQEAPGKTLTKVHLVGLIVALPETTDTWDGCLDSWDAYAFAWTAPPHMRHLDKAPFMEPFGLLDAFGRLQERVIMEALVVGETTNKGVTVRPFVEAFAASEILGKQGDKMVPVAVTAQEARAKHNRRPIEECTGIHEGVPAKDAEKAVDEAMGAQDSIGRDATFNRSQAEALGIVEQRTRQADKTLAEAVKAGEATSKQGIKPLAETVKASEAVNKGANKALAEAVRANEATTKGVGRTVPVALGVQEQPQRILTLQRAFYEDVAAGEALHRAMTKALTVLVGHQENLTKASQRQVAEALGCQEVLGRTASLSRAFNVSLATQAVRGKTPGKRVAEAMRLAEARSRQFYRPLDEVLGLGESQTDPSDQRRNYYSTISLIEARLMTFTLNIAETIGLRDGFIRPWAPGVTSDIGLQNIALTDEAVQELARQVVPFGFTPWARFRDGEYFFREALFRLTVQNLMPGNLSDIKVNRHKVVCDVFDIYDKGTANVAGVTRVFFNKTFHVKPIVTVTGFNTAAFAIPDVVNVEKEYFDVRLKTVDDNTTTGSINWQAQGY